MAANLASLGNGMYQVQKQQDEIKSLRLIIERLTGKLREYQLQAHGNNASVLENDVYFLGQDEDLDGGSPAQQAVIGMLGSHLLGPLFLEYESQARQMERELRAKTLEVVRSGEEMSQLVRENEELSQRLEVQQREYLKLVEETRDNADILAMRHGSAEPSSPTNGGQKVDELKDMK